MATASGKGKGVQKDWFLLGHKRKICLTWHFRCLLKSTPLLRVVINRRKCRDSNLRKITGRLGTRRALRGQKRRSGWRRRRLRALRTRRGRAGAPRPPAWAPRVLHVLASFSDDKDSDGGDGKARADGEHRGGPLPRRAGGISHGRGAGGSSIRCSRQGPGPGAVGGPGPSEPGSGIVPVYLFHFNPPGSDEGAVKYTDSSELQVTPSRDLEKSGYSSFWGGRGSSRPRSGGGTQSREG